MLKIWNASLILATGTLCILGTFLVRSGILDSIHAFGASTLGIPFVTLIGVMIAGSIALVVSRRDALRSEHRLDSLLSPRGGLPRQQPRARRRCAFVVFWGTFFPLIAEALTGERKTVGPPWFDRYTVPLTLVLVLLSRHRAGDRVAPRDVGATRGARSRCRSARALVAVVACVALGADRQRARASSMFGAARVRARHRRARSSGAATGARRAMSGEAAAAGARLARAAQPAPLRRLHRPRRASRCCSSASPRRRRSRTSATCGCARATRRGSATTTVQATSARERRRSTSAAAASRRSASARRCEVQRDGGEPFTLRTERRLLPVDATRASGRSAASSRARRRARSALQAGLLRDFWAAYQPDQAAHPARSSTGARPSALADAPPEQQLRAGARR